jgi:predicted phosphodiesterase
MRVAVLCDIHGNLPALDAVLDEVREAGVDQIVVGGDVLPGPMCRETLARLLGSGIPTDFVYGNGELAVLAQLQASEPANVTYWGVSAGGVAPEPVREMIRWTARQLPDYQELLASWPLTARVEIDGVGAVLVCHATPRNELEIFTKATSEELLLPVFEGVAADVVVCGHTHMQFDRMVGKTRVVNAGSVGMPFGRLGAFWLLLGPDVQLRHTEYDLAAAAARARTTSCPQAEEFFARYILEPPSEEQILAAYAHAELK